MIKLLDKYIASHLFLAIGFVTLGLMGIYVFFDLVQELRVVGRGEYTLPIAFMYLFLTFPRVLYVIFPWSALLGSLLGLGALAMRSELVAMRVASFSIKRIGWCVLKVAFIIGLCVFLLGEWVAPRADRLARRTKMAALSAGQSIQTASGLWVRHENKFIHIRQAFDNGNLFGITLYTLSQTGELQAIEYAEQATYQSGGFLLKKIKGSAFLKEGGARRISESERFVEKLVDLEILKTIEIKHLERLSLKQLWHSIRYHKQHELSSRAYELAFWTKLFHPLEVLIMVLLGLPFIFGPLRNTSIGVKVLTGILVGFGFYGINAIFAPLTEVYMLPPILSACLPSFIFGWVGFYMMDRVS